MSKTHPRTRKDTNGEGERSSTDEAGTDISYPASRCIICAANDVDFSCEPFSSPPEIMMADPKSDKWSSKQIVARWMLDSDSLWALSCVQET